MYMTCCAALVSVSQVHCRSIHRDVSTPAMQYSTRGRVDLGVPRAGEHVDQSSRVKQEENDSLFFIPLFSHSLGHCSHLRAPGCIPHRLSRSRQGDAHWRGSDHLPGLADFHSHGDCLQGELCAGVRGSGRARNNTGTADWSRIFVCACAFLSSS